MPEWTGTFAGAGLYGFIPEDLYHRDIVPGDGSLSVSGAKKMLRPSCPAIYKYDRDHPRRASRSMELGTVVHGMILGTGQPVTVIDAPDYRKKDAQQARDAALAAGEVPMLPHEHAQAEAIVQAVTEHDTAAALLDGADAEVSMYWQDPDLGIWLRGRMDGYNQLFSTPTIVDLKTAADAGPDRFAKATADFGYYMQAPWYCEGLADALNCDPADVDFVFIVVPTTPPYLPMTYRIDPSDAERGRDRNAIAREMWRDCVRTGVWPSWSDEIEDLSLPGYARARIQTELDKWHGIITDY